MESENEELRSKAKQREKIIKNLVGIYECQNAIKLEFRSAELRVGLALKEYTKSICREQLKSDKRKQFNVRRLEYIPSNIAIPVWFPSLLILIPS